MPQLDDYGEQIAGESLAKLEREYKRIYSQAAKEMREKQRKFLKEFEREKSQRLAALDKTEEAEKAYKAWLREQTIGKQWFEGMVDELSRKATEANEEAVATLLDKVPGVYAGNANYEAYAIEKSLKARTAFTLVDADTVRNLVTGRGSRATVAGRLLPEVTFPKIDRPKDYRWNRQKFTSAITQGILQGESIPNIVKRTESIFGSNQAAAYRAARTAVGSAQNSGRFYSMLRAEDMGIIVTKKWIATNDDRTRDSHVELDGVEVPVEEPFESEHGPILYPKDPAADPAEVYNCRCSIKEEVGGFKPLAESYERWLEIQGMDYQEWEAIVAGGKTAAHKVVDGKDILGTWKRRPDKYDFEIDDVIAAQGFDGKPRIVNAEEFDRAVKQANGGNGLVMQRSYSAPDQATLDAYREQLYHGKWYVDCSTGGSQYGQGMYAAADYTGKVTADMQKEMRHYTTLNQERLGAQPLSDEGKEAFLRKWVGENVAEADRDAAFTYLKFESHTGKVEWANVGKAVEQLGEEKRLALLESGVHEDVHQMLNGYSYVETMTLDPSAKVIEWNKIAGEKEMAVFEIRESIIRDVTARGGSNEDIKAALEAHPTYATLRWMDDGAYAAMRGYDAINAVGHGQSGSYTVILNRTKLIIRRSQ